MPKHIKIEVMVCTDHCTDNSSRFAYENLKNIEASTQVIQDRKDFWKLIGKLDSNAVYNELKKQLDLFTTKMGRLPSHITSHHHVHGVSNLLPVFCSIAKEYSIPLRIPIRNSEVVKIPSKSEGLMMTDNFVTDYKGNINRATPENFINSINKYSRGVIEIMVHPGFPGIKADKGFNDWWSQELKVLEDSRVKKFLCKNSLTNYLDIFRAKSNM